MMIGWRVVVEMNSSPRVNTPLTGRPGLLREQRQRRLLRDFVLAAEIAADDGADDADAAHRHLAACARCRSAAERDAPDASHRS